MSKLMKYLVLVIITSFSLSAFAAEIKVTATGKMKYSNEFSEDIKDEAIINAKKAALKKATRKYPKAKLKIIRQQKDEFFESYDDFVVEAKVQREKLNEKSKVYKVSIVATINQNAIQAFLESFAESSSGAESNFGIVAIVTDQVSVKEALYEENTLIDVRTAKEYEKGSIPDAFNYPLFDNLERAEIGVIYRKIGKNAAVVKGLEFFEAHKSADVIHRAECEKLLDSLSKEEQEKAETASLLTARYLWNFLSGMTSKHRLKQAA